MKSAIERLWDISRKKERIILGLMSGTSFDGLDMALCRITGFGINTNVSLLHFITVPFEAAFKEKLKSIFAKRDADLQQVCVMNAFVAIAHAELINDQLKAWNVDHSVVDLIASHGQTIYHAPKWMHPEDDYPNATLQIGDGDHLAVRTGIITISDFRQKHIAAGGEGAPLAVYGDHLMFSDKKESRVMLNIGGISNFTFLPANADLTQVFSTDIGPGNTMMDAYIQKNFEGRYFDKDASVAKEGKVIVPLLDEMMKHPFFKQQIPKTTGPETFNLEFLKDSVRRSGNADVSHADVMATLTALTGKTIADAVKAAVTSNNFVIYASGGGMHNPLVMEHIKNGLPNIEIKQTSDLGIDPDAKEAVLFAVLANETVCGTNKKTGDPRGMPAITMGKISLPD